MILSDFVSLLLLTLLWIPISFSAKAQVLKAHNCHLPRLPLSRLIFPHCSHHSSHAGLLAPWITCQDLASGPLHKLSIPQISASQHSLPSSLYLELTFSIYHPFISATNTPPNLIWLIPYTLLVFLFLFYNTHFLTYYLISFVIIHCS